MLKMKMETMEKLYLIRLQQNGKKKSLFEI